MDHSLAFFSPLRRILLIACAAVSLAACGDSPSAPAPPATLPAAVTSGGAPAGASAAERAQAAASAQAKAPVQTPRDYVLGAGDVVRVNVFQNPELTLESRVSES